MPILQQPSRLLPSGQALIDRVGGLGVAETAKYVKGGGKLGQWGGVKLYHLA